MMINICNAEMESLDLKFNISKCHVLLSFSQFQNICDGLNTNGVVVSTVHSLTHLDAILLAGKLPLSTITFLNIFQEFFHALQPHHSPIFFTGRMPFLPPNQQRQSTEGNGGMVEVGTG